MTNKTYKIKNAFLILLIWILLINNVFTIASQDISLDDLAPKSRICDINTVYEDAKLMSDEEKQCELEYFKKELELSNKTSIENKTLEILVQKKAGEKDNLIKIMNLTRLNYEEHREKTILELFVIKKRFIEKFYEYSKKDLKNKEDVKMQINKYISMVDKQQKARLNISDASIKKLYTDKNSDDFIRTMLPS